MSPDSPPPDPAAPDAPPARLPATPYDPVPAPVPEPLGDDEAPGEPQDRGSLAWLVS